MSTLKAVNFQHPSAVDPAIELESDGSIGGFLGTALDSKLPIAGGKVLQVVRATDATDRSTTSATFVDASISVTITPQKNTSAILLMHVHVFQITGTAGYGRFQITDSSNSAISGAQTVTSGSSSNDGSIFSQISMAYATPATTSAVTYKARFRRNGSTETITILNAEATGQLYAIEVSA